MNIAYFHYRFGDTDGVSLTDDHLSKAFQLLGHKVFFCAGYFKGGVKGETIPLLDFYHPKIKEINKHLFDRNANTPEDKEIFQLADLIQKNLKDFLLKNKIDLIMTSNVLSIGLNLPFAIALTRISQELKLNIVARCNEFWWQREYFSDTKFAHLLYEYLPPRTDNIKFVTINSHTQRRLKEKFGIKAQVLHDLFDYSYKNNKSDNFNSTFRSDFNISKDSLLILQSSRIVRRKRVDRGIILADKLIKYNPTVVITGFDGDETERYFTEVTSLANVLGIDTKFIANGVTLHRSENNGKKIYSYYDAYVNCDLVAYLADLEGFGNQVIETVFFKKPLVVNCYKVYEEDIKKYGFDFVETDGGQITPDVIFQIEELLNNKKKLKKVVDYNYQIGKEHFSIKANLNI